MVMVWSLRTFSLSFSFLSYQSSPGTEGTEAWTRKNSDLLAEVTFLDENTINHSHTGKINKKFIKNTSCNMHMFQETLTTIQAP